MKQPRLRRFVLKKRRRSLLRAIYEQFLSIMLIFSVLAIGLLVIRYFATGTEQFGYLVWNLFLAWIPALVGLKFTQLRRNAPPILTVILGMVWLLFLPNAFYVLSDFIHIQALGEISILYDVVMLFAFSSVGFLLGLASLGVMHLWLRRYLGFKTSASIIFTTIFLCSFAIYLGRYLRWNSWDIIFNPLGLLVDVSDRVISPLDHPRTISTTLLFFVLISVSYIGMWRFVDFVYRKADQLSSSN